NKAVEIPMIVEEMAAPFRTSDEDKIMQVLEERQRITRKEAQELLGVSQSTAGRILKTLVDNGQITQRGGGRTTRYELIKS
ncbi:winged helix-turn-helix transcriptional regulator, partial [Megasphaera massiliensis]